MSGHEAKVWGATFDYPCNISPWPCIWKFLLLRWFFVIYNDIFSPLSCWSFVLYRASLGAENFSLFPRFFFFFLVLKANSNRKNQCRNLTSIDIQCILILFFPFFRSSFYFGPVNCDEVLYKLCPCLLMRMDKNFRSKYRRYSMKVIPMKRQMDTRPIGWRETEIEWHTAPRRGATMQLWDKAVSLYLCLSLRLNINCS